MIKCHDIVKKYDDNNLALNGVSLEIKDGEFISIVGESGSGKSTFLNILGMIDKKDSGSIVLNEINYDGLTAKDASDIRNQEIGYIFQNFYLESEYSVYKNVEIPLLIAGCSRSKRDEIIKNVLQKVGMDGKINQLAKNLSGGEKQRVCIARALVNNPGVILADEPCGNLDSKNTKIILNILKQMNEEGKTIVMVTHSESDSKIADRCIMFQDGKIVNEEIL